MCQALFQIQNRSCSVLYSREGGRPQINKENVVCRTVMSGMRGAKQEGGIEVLGRGKGEELTREIR